MAFQGERGAFSEEAARALLGANLVFDPCPRFEKVFQALAQRQVDFAVIPIENTLAGSVHENYDHLLRFRLPIIGETNVRIVHNLIAPPGVRFSQIRRVYSHPVALNQCLQFFRKHPQIRSEIYYDTAGSVKMIIREAPEGAAAIASRAAAQFYRGRILKHSIEDDGQNFTRFFLLARPKTAVPPHLRPPKNGRGLKTSIVFTTPNVAGAIFRCLSAFALRNISLTKIESRPWRGKPFEYLFYLDFLGSPSDVTCRNALRHLGELTEMLQVLGCYRAGE